MEKHLHIVCLDVPYPVDYGGVFDLFYKLPALQSQGIKIHLHCFEYGRGEQPKLNQYCETVHYYKRRSGLSGLSTNLPYIVSSRSSEQLMENLLLNNYPILMEGIHCTYPLTDKRFSNRRMFVRLHNAEHIYYQQLYRTSSHPGKKLYYSWESKQLLRYQKSIADKAEFWTVSDADELEYRKLGYTRISYLPLFMPPWTVTTHSGKGTYCLYHGNLSVDENERAAIWLLENVFDTMEIPFVIAGKNPSKKLEDMVHKFPHACVVGNPSEKELQDMISKAHVNVIPSFNATGVKLKLYNALFNGRHCLVNAASVLGTGLEECCHVAESGPDFFAAVQRLQVRKFTMADVQERRELLHSMFDNQHTAARMVNMIWPAVDMGVQECGSSVV